MNICDMERGDVAVVLSVCAEKALRERLKVLGIYAGARIKLLKTSFFRKTFLLSSASGKVALGKSVASEVEICPVR